jgi:hypothetical protein
VGHVACKGEMRNIYRILTGKREGNKPLRRPGRRWEDNFTMNLKGITNKTILNSNHYPQANHIKQKQRNNSETQPNIQDKN